MVGNLLLRGMLVGILAGLFAFGFARIFGEPQVERAIAYEEQMAVADGAQAEAEPEAISRSTQAGIGLLVGSVIYGAAIGGLFALIFAYIQGRVSTLGPRATAGLLALAAFVAVVLAPAIKYPATPPAVGSADTIAARTELFFVMLVFSVAAATASIALARRLLAQHGAWNAGLIGAAAFVGLIAAAQYALPTINEVPDGYSADLLWRFRTSSLGMHAVLWTVIGLGFGVVAERSFASRRSVSRSMR